MPEEQEQDPQKVQRMLEEQAEGEALSFQALVREYGEFPVQSSTTDGVGEGGQMDSFLDAPTGMGLADSVADGSLLDRDSLFMEGTVVGDTLPGASARKRFEDDMRVLAASGGKKTPIWLQALFIGGFSLLLLLPIVGKSGFVMFQPWYSYGVLFLAGVTAFWSIYGMVHEEEPNERWLCLIGLGMALAATAIAWVTRVPPQFS